MSGGEYDYAYQHVLRMAEKMDKTARGCAKANGSNSALRRAFARHMLNVAEAMQAIEWNDSGDGDDHEPMLIKRCLRSGDVLRSAIDHAKKALEELTAEIERAEQEAKQ